MECDVPEVDGWGAVGYDFLDCETNDCLMQHDVSVTVSPAP